MAVSYCIACTCKDAVEMYRQENKFNEKKNAQNWY
jgi:hypothetical protein